MSARTEYVILSTHDADGEPVRLVRVDVVSGFQVKYRGWTAHFEVEEQGMAQDLAKKLEESVKR